MCIWTYSLLEREIDRARHGPGIGAKIGKPFGKGVNRSGIDVHEDRSRKVGCAADAEAPRGSS
jgi:hypothetical protein